MYRYACKWRKSQFYHDCIGFLDPVTWPMVIYLDLQFSGNLCKGTYDKFENGLRCVAVVFTIFEKNMTAASLVSRTTDSSVYRMAQYSSFAQFSSDSFGLRNILSDKDGSFAVIWLGITFQDSPVWMTCKTKREITSFLWFEAYRPGRSHMKVFIVLVWSRPFHHSMLSSKLRHLWCDRWFFCAWFKTQ